MSVQVHDIAHAVHAEAQRDVAEAEEMRNAAEGMEDGPEKETALATLADAEEAAHTRAEEARKLDEYAHTREQHELEAVAEAIPAVDPEAERRARRRRTPWWQKSYVRGSMRQVQSGGLVDPEQVHCAGLARFRTKLPGGVRQV